MASDPQANKLQREEYHRKKQAGICTSIACSKKAKYGRLCYLHWLCQVYHTIAARCGNPDNHHKDKSYAKIKLKMSRAEFVAWATATKPTCAKPSVERIDSKGHYEVGNIKWLPLLTNLRHKGRQHRIPHGKYECSMCKKVFPRTAEFFHHRGDWFKHICKRCAHILRKKRYHEVEKKNGSKQTHR